MNATTRPATLGGATGTSAARTLARVPRRVPFPRTWGLRASDAYAFAGLNAALILGMWIRHGNLHELTTLAGAFTAAGQLAALYGTYLALIQVVLVSRSPYLDEVFGTDHLLWLHRWGGFLTVWLLVGHFVLTTVGWGMGDGSGTIAELGTLLFSTPYVLWSAVSLGLFVAVAVLSVRAARRKLGYETWFGIHLYLYLAIALGFMHQLVVGSDFASDPIARFYWIGLYVLTFGSLLVWRFGLPIVSSVRHDLRVANVVDEAPGVVSIYLTGRDLDRLAVRAGQWFLFRFLTRTDWYKAHPFSLSAAPNGKYLRISVKDLGDDTAKMQRLRIGTRVAIEGPYGILTGAKRTKRRVLLVGAGIGITPLRALLEELPAAPGDVTLLYRASRPQDVAFRAEFDQLARMRGATIHYLVGKRGSAAMPRDPFEPASIAALVPDVRDRDVYICGPNPMMTTLASSLDALRVPSSQVHLERFAY
jgi:predicted ferric reductase